MGITSSGPRRLGREPASSRQAYVLFLNDLAEFPEHLDLPCRRFVLLLAADFGVPSVDRAGLAERMLDAGCVYFCAWGPGCELMHDVVDETEVARDLFRETDGTIMTTWHNDESLADATHFALISAEPDGVYSPGCDAIVLAVAANAQWLAEVESAAAQYLR